MLVGMDLSRLDTMDADELRSYLAFLLWHYRVMDSFWFLYMVDEYSQEAARSSTSGSGRESPVWPRAIW